MDEILADNKSLESLINILEQLDSLLKLKFPFLVYENIPWASHTRLCNMHHWSKAYTVAAEQVAEFVEGDIDRRSITPRRETEGAQEDGELPVVSLLANLCFLFDFELSFLLHLAEVH